ncbi:MAG: type I restriction enzyme HsdR N-terminal domain-containing protein, partial [Schleiferiaceae bacterium]|nr:type I restriction enzyme HsdR N-terminal domain-containing protein [Schleiferiaceae bacterium]
MLQFNFNKNRVQPQQENAFVCLKRGKVIQANAEEYVRQAVLHFLINELHVHAKDIEVEFSMRKLDAQSSGRADLYVQHRNKVLLLVECKAPGVPLTDETLNYQAKDYASSADYPELLWLTNGIENRYYVFDSYISDYRRITELPDFRDPNQMTFHYFHETFTPWASPSFSEIWDQKFQKQFELDKNYSSWTTWFTAGHNPTASRAAIIRLGEWLFFTDRIPAHTRIGSFEIVEDLGVMIKSVPAPDGHRYWNDTRVFSIKNCLTKLHQILDIQLTISNKRREVHLALRLSEKGSGSFTLQAALDQKVTWSTDKKQFLLAHSPSKISMSKYYLPISKIDFIRQEKPELLQNDDLFYTNWINATAAPTASSPDYLAFIGQWVDYVAAIKALKQANRMATPALTDEEKAAKKARPNILSEAKALQRQGKTEAAIQHILDNLEQIGRKEKALQEAFSWAFEQGLEDKAMEIIDTTSQKSKEYVEMKCEMLRRTCQLDEMLKLAKTHPSNETLIFYWEGMFFQELNENGYTTQSLHFIKRAFELNPTYNDLKIALACNLWFLGNAKEAIDIFKILNTFYHLDSSISYDALSILIELGEYEKCIIEAKRELAYDSALSADEKLNFYFTLISAHFYNDDFESVEKAVG